MNAIEWHNGPAHLNMPGSLIDVVKIQKEKQSEGVHLVEEQGGGARMQLAEEQTGNAHHLGHAPEEIINDFSLMIFSEMIFSH